MSLRMDAGFERLKDALASVIAKEVEFPRGWLLTVLGAKMTANTKHAKVIISLLPAGQEDEAIRILKERDREIKQGLAERLRLRRIPTLHYTFDVTGSYVAAIDNAITHLKQRGEL